MRIFEHIVSIGFRKSLYIWPDRSHTSSAGPPFTSVTITGIGFGISAYRSRYICFERKFRWGLDWLHAVGNILAGG